MEERIAIVGLGYVGLPLALALADQFPGTIGFDINVTKIDELRSGIDRTGEISTVTLRQTSLRMTHDVGDLCTANVFIVAVPTPVDKTHSPDLTPVIKASELVGSVLNKGAVVVYESTVYPGVTEDICGPILAKVSGLRQGIDFKLGYSPERINPGDREHTVERIVKVVSGEDAQTADRLARIYGAVINAGVHVAPSIRVAEAAKVIENTQRDLNIALMNELAMIFDRLEINTRDVLAAAGTKWNFLHFSPGLVGGHCIGVDPYYLTTKAEEVGYHPQVILAGRRINDGMGAFVAQRTIKMLVQASLPINKARIGILGLTFKEDISDLRNSRVPDIVQELKQFCIEPLIHDPFANRAEALSEYGLSLVEWDAFPLLDALIIAVPHQPYREKLRLQLESLLKPSGVVVDVKGMLNPADIPASLHYWSL